MKQKIIFKNFSLNLSLQYGIQTFLLGLLGFILFNFEKSLCHIPPIIIIVLTLITWNCVLCYKNHDTWIEMILHEFIFFKNSWYKNTQRLNLKIFVKCLFMTFLISLISFTSYYFLSEKELPDIKIMIGFTLTVFSALYWNFHKIYQTKWLYIANLFNETENFVFKNKRLMLDHDCDKKKVLLESQNLIKESYLAIDVMRLDMWSNKSITNFMNQFIMKVLTEKQDQYDLFFKNKLLASDFEREISNYIINKDRS